MILLIDNYDSFTFNLYHFLGDLGSEVEVRRNDALTSQEALALRPRGDRALARSLHAERGRHLPAADRRRRRGRVPLLGVCLGHQAIGQAFGGKVVRAPDADAWQGLGRSTTAAPTSSPACPPRSAPPATIRLIVDRATCPPS